MNQSQAEILLYLANNIFRVDTASKLTSDKEYGIDGFMTKITIIKSRSNRAGQEIDLVYNQNRGFDNIYSNFTLLKTRKTYWWSRDVHFIFKVVTM